MKYALLVFGILGFLNSSVSWGQEDGLFTEVSTARVNSKWGSSYFSFSGTEAKAVNDGAPSFFIYNYIGANYKLSQDERINIRPAFVLTTAGFNGRGEAQKSGAKLDNLYINYSNRRMALLPGDWQMAGQYRVYLPTSEESQKRKMIMALHSWMTFGKLLGDGWSLEYNMKPTYYVQSQNSYRNEYDRTFPDGGSTHVIEAKANKWGELDHYFSVGKYLNRVFTPGVDIGFIHAWNHTSEFVRNNQASRNQLKLAPNTEIHWNRDLWFVLGAESAVDLNNSRYTTRWEDDRGQSINLFHPENTQYYLMTFLTL